MCDYCTPETGKYLTSELFASSRIIRLKQVGKDDYIWALRVNGETYTEIKYCPKCGRELID